MYRIENSYVSEIFFKFNNYLFFTGTPVTEKLDDGIPVTYFSGLQVPVLELQTNSIKQTGSLQELLSVFINLPLILPSSMNSLVQSYSH